MNELGEPSVSSTTAGVLFDVEYSIVGFESIFLSSSSKIQVLNPEKVDRRIQTARVSRL